MLDGQDYKQEEILAAVKALYMLSFDETNKATIKSDSNTVVLLRSLQNSDNKEIQQAASGIIWEIEGKEEHDTHCTGTSVFFAENGGYNV